MASKLWVQIQAPTLLVLALCLLLSPVCLSYNYGSGSFFYISPSGSDLALGNSSAESWQTFDPLCGATELLGATVYVDPGHYNVSGSPCQVFMEYLLGSSGIASDVQVDVSSYIGSNTNYPFVVSSMTIYAISIKFPAFLLRGSTSITNMYFDVSSGGAMEVISGTAEKTIINDTVVVYNVVTAKAAAVIASNGHVSMTNVSMSGYYGGGGAVSAESSLVLYNCSVSNHRGGPTPLFLTGYDFVLSGSTFKNNSGDLAGVLTMNALSLPPIDYYKNTSILAVVGNIAPISPYPIGPPNIFHSGIGYIGGVIEDSVFENNAASNGAGAVLVSINITASAGGTLDVSNSIFVNNTGIVGAVWIGNATNQNVPNVNKFMNYSVVFNETLFQGNQGTLYGSLLISTFEGGVLIDSCDFLYSSVSMISSIYATSTVLLDSNNATVQNSVFMDNSAPYCAHLLVLGADNMTVLDKNEFLGSKTLETAPVCLIGKDTDTPVYTSLVTNNTFQDTTFVQGMSSPLTNATQLNLWFINAILQDNTFVGSSRTAAISIGDYANITIKDSTATPTKATLPGFILFAANLKISVADLTVTGVTSFLSMANSSVTSTITGLLKSKAATTIYFQATELLAETETSFDYPVWLQQASFSQIHMVMERSTIVCCNAGDVYGPISFDAYSEVEFSSGNHWWFNNRLPVVFKGTSSTAIYVDQNATLTIKYPVRNESRQYINASISVDGSLEIIDAVISGSIFVSPIGTLRLYPSTWGNNDHRVAVYGSVSVLGTIYFDEIFALSPFTPLISYNGTVPYPVMEYGTSGSYSTATLLSNYLHYSVAEAATSGSGIISSSSFFMNAIPIGLVPESYIDDTGSAIFMEFVLPPPRSYACSELGLDSTQFDIYSITCSWQSATEVRVSSPILPLENVKVFISTSDLAITNPYFGVEQAENPVTPTAAIVALPPVYPCGQDIMLDGSLSTGLGSYPAAFNWTLVSPNQADVSLILAQQNTTIAYVPNALLSLDTEYIFALQVTNWAGIMSAVSTPVNTTTASTNEPRIRIVGNSHLHHYVGNDLILTVAVVQDACSSTDAIVFGWEATINGTLVKNTSVNSPSLLIPGSLFQSPVNGLQVSLIASYSGSSAYSEVFFTIDVLEAPFFLVQQSPKVFYDADPTLFFDLHGFGPSIASISWSVSSCPIVDGSQARTHVSGTASAFTTSANSSIDLGQDVIVCLHSDGSSYPVNIIANGASAHIDHTSIDYGDYTVTANVTTHTGVSKTLDFKFELKHSQTVNPPSVFIQVPDGTSILQPASRLVFLSVVNGNTFANTTGSFKYMWSVSSGVSHTNANLKAPNLVLSYTDVLPGQLVIVNLEVFDLSSGLSGNYSATFARPTAPFGGQLSVSPSFGYANATTFSFSSSPWSALHLPIKYQFAVVTTLPSGGSETIFLTGLLDSPVLNLSLAMLNQYASLMTSSQNVSVSAVLNVFDGLGSVANSTISGLVVQLNPVAVWTSDADIATLINQLGVAVNHSDWTRGTVYIAQLMSGLRGRMNWVVLQGNASFTIAEIVAYAATNADAVNAIFNGLTSLADSLVYDDKSVATLMLLLRSSIRFLESHPVFTLTHLDGLLSIVQNVLTASRSSFGQQNIYAYHTTTSIIDIAGQLLSVAVQLNLTSPITSAQALLPTFGHKVLQSIYPGEGGLTHNALYGELALAAHQVETNSAAEELIDFSEAFGVALAFTPSDFASQTTNGYVGYHNFVYNDSFPFMSADAATKTVISLSINAFDGSTSKRAAMVTTSTISANFTNLNSSSVSESGGASCATYDSSSGSWSTSDCTTTSSSDSSISCTCSTTSNPALLTALLGSSSPPSPSSSLTTGDIIAIAVCSSVVVLAAITVAAVVAFKPLRALVQPYYGTSGNNVAHRGRSIQTNKKEDKQKIEYEKTSENNSEPTEPSSAAESSEALFPDEDDA